MSPRTPEHFSKGYNNERGRRSANQVSQAPRIKQFFKIALLVPKRQIQIRIIELRSSNRMDHIPLEQLERYLRDEIEPEHVAIVEEHLLVCQECRDALERLEEEARVMREALRQLRET